MAINLIKRPTIRFPFDVGIYESKNNKYDIYVNDVHISTLMISREHVEAVKHNVSIGCAPYVGWYIVAINADERVIQSNHDHWIALARRDTLGELDGWLDVIPKNIKTYDLRLR